MDFLVNAPESFYNQYLTLAPLSKKYLDPKVDLVFKRVFGTRKHLTIDFLNAMLPLPAPITELEFELTESKPEHYEGRVTIVDFRCRDANGRHFRVEMQNNSHPRFLERLLFNCCRVYGYDLRRGDKFRLIQPVYMLAIADFNLRRGNDDWYHHFYITDGHGKVEDFHSIEMIVVELPKYAPPDNPQARDIWTRFLREIDVDTDNAPPELEAYAPVKEALAIAEEGAYELDERVAYQTEVLNYYINLEQDRENEQIRKERDRLMEEQDQIKGERDQIKGKLDQSEIERKKMRISLSISARALREQKFSLKEIAELLRLDVEETRKLLEEDDLRAYSNVLEYKTNRGNCLAKRKTHPNSMVFL